MSCCSDYIIFSTKNLESPPVPAWGTRSGIGTGPLPTSSPSLLTVIEWKDHRGLPLGPQDGSR